MTLRTSTPEAHPHRCRTAAATIACACATVLAVGTPAEALDTTHVQSMTAQVVTTERAQGQTEAENSGVPGQCTWGAKELFYQATGQHPMIYGNALEWADSAAAHGWTVVADAEARSI